MVILEKDSWVLCLIPRSSNMDALGQYSARISNLKRWYNYFPMAKQPVYYIFNSPIVNISTTVSVAVYV